MDQKDLCEHTKIRLIAAAIGHQQCTKTAANVIPLPGTKRLITIGTPAEVVALLRREVPDRGPIIGEGDGAALAAALDDWMTQSVLHQETNLPEDVAALFGACGFEIRSTDPAEKHPLAVCGSLDAAGLLVETVLTEFGKAAPTLPKQQVADLAARCGIKASDEKLAEFAALLRDAEPIETLVPLVEVAPDAAQAAPVDLPDVLFDGKAVYDEVVANDPNTHPTSDNVADVLDAVVRLVRRAANTAPATPVFDFHAHLARQAAWSQKTFGPGPRTKGVCDHIRKELLEIEADPSDLGEWIDVVILGLDGAWRCGGTPQQIIDGIVAKQTKNEGRTWPDWRTADPDKAIEHDRSADQLSNTEAGDAA